MAVTLEQYSLVLSANAENASRGVDRLIGSLSRLQGALASALAPLRELATTMSTIATASASINVANIQQAATAASRGARRAAALGANAERPTQEEVRDFANGFTREEALNWRRAGIEDRIGREMARPEMDQSRIGSAVIQYQNVMNQIGRLQPAPEVQPPVDANAAAQAAAQAAEAGNAAAQAGQQAAQAGQQAARAGEQAAQAGRRTRQAGRDAAQAGNAAAQAGQQAAQAGNGFQQLQRQTHHASGTLSRFGRMFTSMAMRLAIRTLFSAFSSAWDAMKRFSENANGPFANAIKQMHGAVSSAALNILSAFAPAIQACVPVVNVLASAIRFLSQSIQWLFSLLGMTSEFFGVATNDITKYAKGAGGAGKANKGLLASFDELNVIGKQSGGGGGGGSGFALTPFSDIITEEMAKLQVIIGESMLAIGLILAFTGHVPVGVAMMALGAAAIVKTVTEDWGSLSEDIKRQILDIMFIAGTATLAVGAIIAFSGANIPLGIGLMAIGAANLAGVAALSWDLSDDIKAHVGELLSYLGGALLVIGAIMAFSGANIPLGIGLMIAGGLALGAAVGLNWDSVPGKISGIAESIKNFLVSAWNAVKNAVAGAWESVKKWWEDSGIGEKVRGAWTAATTWMSNTWSSIKTSVANAWDSAKKWWEESGIGQNVRNAWSTATSWLSDQWDNIKSSAYQAWGTVQNWWKTNVTDNVKKKGVWGGVEGFFTGLWESVKGAAAGAWNTVKTWWEDSGVGSWVRSWWEPALDDLSGKWDDVKTHIHQAWGTVTNWWNNSNVGKWVNDQWDKTMTGFGILWDGIKDKALQAWNTVTNWWNNSNVKTWVDDNWDDPLANLGGLWNAVWEDIQNAWDAVKKWWEENILSKIQEKWNGVKTFFEGVFQPIIDAYNWLKKILGLDGQTAEVGVNVAITYEETNKLKNAVSSVGNAIMSSITKGLGSFAIPAFAGGAYDIPAGDLFIANEAGTELIGNIGGKPSVANNQQIIEGISNGVRDANAEQNDLLRQQNDLLRELLHKELVAKVSPSASLGAVVNRSQRMYEQAAGV